MALPQTIVLDVPNLLSASAVFVSLLSAIYAARSAGHARRQATATESSAQEARLQNRIATNAERLKIYKALLAFRVHLVVRMADFEEAAVWQFWEHVEVADFYFSSEVSHKLGAIVTHALDLHKSRNPPSEPSVMTASDVSESRRRLVEELCRLVGSMDLVDTDLRKELRLVEG